MTLTITAASTSTDTPSLQINVTSSPSVTDTVKVWRTHEDGSVHRVLTEPNPVIVGSWVGFDYHAPFNQAVTYYAQAGGLTSAASAAAWLVSDDAVWLIHPSTPGLSVLVDMVTAVADYEYEDSSTKFQVLNRKLPVHQGNGPTGGETGSVTVMCETDSGEALRALLGTGGPILLNSPFPGDLTWKWVQPGKLKIANPGINVGFPVRTATFPYEETTQPDADAAPVWTAGQLKAAYATAGSAKAAYSSARNMKLNVVG